jgi:hypothetical protein
MLAHGLHAVLVRLATEAAVHGHAEVVDEPGARALPAPEAGDTPADLHYGRAGQVREARAGVLADAHAAHPERFVRKPPAPPQLPGPAWINRPASPEAVEERS